MEKRGNSSAMSQVATLSLILFSICYHLPHSLLHFACQQCTASSRFICPRQSAPVASHEASFCMRNDGQRGKTSFRPDISQGRWAASWANKNQRTPLRRATAHGWSFSRAWCALPSSRRTEGAARLLLPARHPYKQGYLALQVALTH